MMRYFRCGLVLLFDSCGRFETVLVCRQLVVAWSDEGVRNYPLAPIEGCR